jgi:hypothetical protein
MNVNIKAQILGAKGFKGTVEGQAFDSTKLYVVMETSDRAGTEVGFNASPLPWGKQENFERIKAWKFPFEAELVVQVTTKGMEVVDMRAASVPKAA